MVHAVTCVPSFVFWKLCTFSSLLFLAQVLQSLCELVSLQLASWRRLLWCLWPGPPSLQSSSFSAGLSPSASHALWLPPPVSSLAGAVTKIKHTSFSKWQCRSKIALTRCIIYHIRGLKAWVLVKGGAPKAALKKLDEMENKARTDLH